MAIQTFDDIIGSLSAGQQWRSDFMKTYTGGTVVAGRWYDLTYFGGTPPAYLHGNLVSNYDFLAGASNWTFSAGFSWTAATHLMTKANSGSVETLQQNIECMSGFAYEVIWTVGSYAGSGNLSMSIGGGTAVTRAANGTFTETVTAGATNVFLISCATTITAVTIDVIIVRKLRSFTPYSADTTIYPYNAAGQDLNVYNGGNVSSAVKSLINGGAWTNVAAGAPSVLMIVDMLGCYPKIRTDLNTSQVLDNQEHINNGTFTGGTTGWTVNAGWAYGTNNVLKNGAGTNTLTQTMTYSTVIGKTYTVEYDITSFTTTGTLQVACGGVTGSARTITGTGSYIETFTAVSSTATFSITPSDAIRITIDNVSVGIGCARYGDGKGVMAYYVIDTSNGANAQNFSMTYSGTQGLSARNLGAVVANTASAIQSHLSHSGVAAGNFGPFLPLAQGDAGVAEVDSALFSAASASAGFVNVVLCKPLATIPLTAAFYASERDLLNQLPSLPQIKDGACLGFLIFAGAVIPNPCMYQGYLTSVWK